MTSGTKSRGGCNIKEEEGAWLLGPRDGVKQKSVDEHLATLYLPKHHKDDYGVKDLLHRVTMIKVCPPGSYTRL
jgi:hypothetical protein